MIEVDSISAEKLLNKLSLIDKNIEVKFSEFLDTQARVLETKIKQRLDSVGAIDTGQAKQGIHSQQSGLKAEVRSNTLHSSIIEYGRRPGTFPDIGALRRWAQRKGVGAIYSLGGSKAKTSSNYGVFNIRTRKQSDADASLDNAVFMIGMSIKNKGIKARPFFYITWSDYKGQFNNKMVSLFKRVIAGK